MRQVNHEDMVAGKEYVIVLPNASFGAMYIGSKDGSYYFINNVSIYDDKFLVFEKSGDEVDINNRPTVEVIY